jgi:predicted RNA-binding Zn-ribbon protein involved in translation (DUF1610 family)
MTEDTTTADSLAKATLFCPECGHESRHDGDWLCVERSERVHYLCPDCDTEITVRSAPETDDSADVWQAWANRFPRVTRQMARLATAPLLMAMFTRLPRYSKSGRTRDD